MSDLIDRQAAIDAASHGCHELRGVFEEVKEMILRISPADYEDVVRCKDCIYQDKGENESEAWNICRLRPWYYIQTTDNDFCSYGECKDGCLY